MKLEFPVISNIRNTLDALRIGPLDRVLLAKHLATMIHAGIPLDESLEILSEEASSSRLRKVMAVIKARVDAGESLSDSLRRHPAVFSNLFVEMVRIGEESGTLEENLRYVAEQMEHDYDIRRKIKSASAYPILVLVMALGMGAGLSYFIIPKLVPLFSSLNVELPLPTRIVLGTSVFLTRYGSLVAVGGIIGFFILRFVLRLPPIRPFWHKTIIRFPLLGKIVVDSNLARFTRTLGIMLKSGLPIANALLITEQTLQNEAYKRLVRLARVQVEKGVPFSEGMRMSLTGRKVLPVIVPRMIGVGERTGSMDEALLSLADFYEREVDATTKNLATVLEPMLLIIIGLIVGLIAIAIIGPIYKLTGSISPTGR